MGEGASGIIGAYGARLFSSTGVQALAITHPYYPPPGKDMEDTVVFVLSISGENAHMLSLINSYKKRRVKLISITNTDQCTIARISRLNFACYMPLIYAWPEVREASLTTQIPVVCILELVAGKLAERDGLS